MPNKCTPDPNANQVMDIMRCKMQDSEKAYMELARSEHEITVEILREKESLITFVVPWKSRVQSRYLSRPGDESGADLPDGSSKKPWASKFDPWRGFDKTKPGEWKRDKVYMCIPGMETAPSRKVRAANTLLDVAVVKHVEIFHLTSHQLPLRLTLSVSTPGTGQLPRVHPAPLTDGSVTHLPHCPLRLGWTHHEKIPPHLPLLYRRRLCIHNIAR
jgi:hypothetical protein